MRLPADSGFFGATCRRFDCFGEPGFIALRTARCDWRYRFPRCCAVFLRAPLALAGGRFRLREEPPQPSPGSLPRRLGELVAPPNFASQVREWCFRIFTFCGTGTLTIASPENSHLCARPLTPPAPCVDNLPLNSPPSRRTRVFTAGPFLPAVVAGVYHSFPALFCAGDSRIVERLFVTCFRRGEVCQSMWVPAQLPQLTPPRKARHTGRHTPPGTARTPYL